MNAIRCKPGDLALVIYDIPACIKNVGRLVHVRGPLMLNRVYQMDCWLIEPLSGEAWYVDHYSHVRRRTDFSNRKLEHPDQWLMPVRPRDSESKRVQLTEILTPRVAAPAPGSLVT